MLGQLRGLYTAEPMSWDFFGTKAHMHIMADGRFRITVGRNENPEPEVEYPADLSHFQNFAEAVRARDPKRESRPLSMATAGPDGTASERKTPRRNISRPV